MSAGRGGVRCEETTPFHDAIMCAYVRQWQCLDARESCSQSVPMRCAAVFMDHVGARRPARHAGRDKTRGARRYDAAESRLRARRCDQTAWLQLVVKLSVHGTDVVSAQLCKLLVLAAICFGKPLLDAVLTSGAEDWMPEEAARSFCG